MGVVGVGNWEDDLGVGSRKCGVLGGDAFAVGRVGLDDAWELAEGAEIIGGVGLAIGGVAVVMGQFDREHGCLEGV